MKNKKAYVGIIMNPWFLVVMVGVIILFGGSVYESFNVWIQTTLNGPEYCFDDITQSEISVASGGVSISYTQTEGDQICFRTKDYSIVERLNQQIQNRKLEERLAEIEASSIFWNQTFPKLAIFGLIALVVIIGIIALSNRNQRGYY